MKINLISILVFFVLIQGCGLPTEQRCEIIKNSAQIATQLALQNSNLQEQLNIKEIEDENNPIIKEHIFEIQEDIKRQQKIIEILNSTTKKLRNNDLYITKNDLDNILELLNKEMSLLERVGIQTGINTALSYIEMPRDASKSIVGEIASAFACIFEGASQSFVQNINKQMKTLKNVKELKKQNKKENNSNFKIKSEKQKIILE